MEAILLEGLSSTVIGFLSVCLLVPLISYLVYKFSIKEKSFEEVLEEQRRRQLEEEAKQKLEKNKKKEKFKRNWAKKKEKADHEPIVPEIIAPEQEKEIPVIIEPKDAQPVKQKNKKQNQSPNQNADARNNVEKAEKESVVVPSENTTTKAKNSPPLKQEVKKDSAPQAKKDASKAKKESPQAAKEPETKTTSKQVAGEAKKKTPEVVDKVTAPNAVAKPQEPANNVAAKKKKKEPVETDVNMLTAGKLFSLVKDVALDTDEIQRMIDILLNKQKDSASWTKPNDPLASTKRNLQEKEQRLEMEMQQNKSVVLKLKEVREENIQLKEKYSALEKSSQEKIGKMQQEIQVFQNKLKQLQEVQVKEKAKLEKQTEDKKKPADEVPKQKAPKVETEVKNSANKLEQDSAKLMQLQKAHTLLIEQHTQFVASHNKETKQKSAQIVDLEKKLEELKVKNANLSKEVHSANDVKAALEKAKLTAEEKLKSEMKHSAELDLKMKNLNSGASNITELQAEIKNLQLENERLTEQLVSTKERVAGDGQEIIHQNGELNGNIPDEATLKSLEEKSRLLKEKESDLSRLGEELNQLKAKVSLLDDETEQQKKKNNDLREKNWKAMEALKKSEELAESRLKELEASATKFNEASKVYEEKLKAQQSSNKSATDVEAKMAKVESEAAKRLADYNSEVEKNKQLASQVEKLNAQNSRLSAMEKTVEELSSQIKEGQCRTRECMQRIHPEISVDSSLPHDAWVEEFEKLVLLSARVSAPSNEEEIALLKSQLEEKDAELSLKDKHYKTTLSELESLLHNLENSAKTKEIAWQDRLSAKENELQNLAAEKAALIKEKETIQTTFQQQSQLEELEIKLNELKSALEGTENDRSHLEQKYDEVNKNCINLRDQLANKETQIAELQKEKKSSESLRQMSDDLKEKLDKEKKINKDFSSQMVKLHSLVKIGQDSLAAEQELVKKLKSELEALKVSTTNGGTTITSTVTQSESHLKTKGTDKSKKKSDVSVKK